MEPEMIQQLISAAQQAREKAYAPYSGFQVGAAVLSESGQIYTGCNVENASYGLTVCAERIAIFKAVSSGERSIQAIAITTSSDEIANCCGACLQVMQEFSDPQNLMTVINANKKGQFRVLTLNELMPYPFDLKNRE